jgi:predicted GNAT family N-acyltransferase
VRKARTPDEVEAALRLRHRVFVHEQGVDTAADRDGRDGEALHAVAMRAGDLVGTCRVIVDGDVGRLGRMAVEPELRGRGAGAALLEEAERMAKTAGATQMRLHAQLAARSLYSRAGYATVGEPFLEEGIEHVTMEKLLA